MVMDGKRIIRVFPRRTKATPDDELAVVNRSPELFDCADEVHVSVTWTWDLPVAERLAEQWKYVAPVTIGGPATGQRGEDFVGGRYIKHGYTITSRGCPNKCWFCSVWRRDGTTRELPIVDGWNILDDNLLACSDAHVRQVFDMLGRQNRKPEFTGGLEAKILKPWHAVEMKRIGTKQAFFAYDTPDDYEPLRYAGRVMQDAGFIPLGALRCYVLCGWPKDTMDEADKRMVQAAECGFMPMAMLYRDKDGKTDSEWRKFQRTWARPAIIRSRLKTVTTKGD